MGHRDQGGEGKIRVVHAEEVLRNVEVRRLEEVLHNSGF